MSSQLDPAILAAINQEARQCFLDEDAPEYLQTLEEGFQNRHAPDYTALLRATHSLKGGAGIAQLPSLKDLAHKLEDLLQGLQQGRIKEVEASWQLIERGIGEVAFILSQAQVLSDDVPVDAEFSSTLAAFIHSQSLSTATETSQASSKQDDWVKKALREHLDSSLAAVNDLSPHSPPETLKESLGNFYDECLLLGETFELSWLLEAIAPLKTLIEEYFVEEAFWLTQEVITQLRDYREEYLNQEVAEVNINPNFELNQELSSSDNSFIVTALNQDLEECIAPVEQLSADSSPEAITECLQNFSDDCSFLGETLNLSWIGEILAPLETAIAESSPPEALELAQKIVAQLRLQRSHYLQGSLDSEDTEETAIQTVIYNQDIKTSEISLSTPELPTAAPSVSEQAPLSQLRIPLKRLEGMTNNVEELILIQSRLQLQQQYLQQANKRLYNIARQFEPLREQIQTLYNQMAIESTNVSSFANTDDSSSDIFDSLELDRYTELHTSLQSFQELILQVQETRTDLTLVDQDLAEDLEQSKKNLDVLYTEVNKSRLVPFRLLAQRFLPQIQNLNRRFTDKSVKLEIEGEETLIDQLLLEQLQTPLTHLLNNAFDHGIETSSERLTQQKPETAQIILQARVNNNQLVITIKDDGRGIDLYKVYQKAIAKGLCPINKTFEELNQEQILDWIFQSDFSTAEKVSDLSGRGMGLDIVRAQVRKLRGNIQVTTKRNQGTTFTLKFPLNISLMSLFLVQVDNRVLAIPINSVRETLPYKEIDWLTTKPPTANWQQEKIAVLPLANLLSLSTLTTESTSGKVAIVVEGSSGMLMITVDSILAETQLIVKPFDDTVPIPSYLAGCTILGTGEIIPVVLPQAFSSTNVSLEPVDNETVTTKQKTVTVLVAEDSVATRRLLERLLTTVGYQVVPCRDGKVALEELEQRQGEIDLIVSDVEMPRVNGFQLLQQLRANPAWEQIPVIMATSRTGDRHRNQAMQLGANGYLGKPIQPQELLSAIESLLI